MNFVLSQLIIVKQENVLFIAFLRSVITKLNIRLIMHYFLPTDVFSV